jgi:acetoin utilization deacetylase AcuC-like enzyme
MTTLILTHLACLEHDTGKIHPESSERLRRVLSALSDLEFSGLEWRQAPIAEHGQLVRAHDPQYVADVLNSSPSSGRVQLEGSGTVVSPGSEEAALRAAGAVCAAVDAVAKAEVTNAFCAVRPPGHHAEPSRTLGFCLFGNIAIGARHAQMVHGLTRVAAIDFDVHHGNGTQEIFKNDENLFFASTHQSFIFPSSTSADERDEPNLVNVCLARGWGGKEFRRLFENKVLPRLVSFAPDLIMISAGFDALRQDPIGDLNLDDSDFFWATEKLTVIAARRYEGRLVSALEGGYNPGATSFACAAHVRALMAA